MSLNFAKCSVLQWFLMLIPLKLEGETKNTLIPWKEVSSKKKWYGSYKSGSRVLERYYAEGAALGYGVNVEGEVSIGASKEPYEASIDVKASATIGSTCKIKYQAVAWTATKWTNSNFGYKVY